MSCAEPKRKCRCIGTVRPRRPMTSRRSGRILIVTGPSSCCRSCHVTTSGRRTGRTETASLTSVGPVGVGSSTPVRRRLAVEAPIELGLRTSSTELHRVCPLYRTVLRISVSGHCYCSTWKSKVSRHLDLFMTSVQRPGGGQARRSCPAARDHPTMYSVSDDDDVDFGDSPASWTAAPRRTVPASRQVPRPSGRRQPVPSRSPTRRP